MSETGFKCPKCGQAESFTADSVELYNARVYVTKDGWDYCSEGADACFCDLTHMKCDECGHDAHYSDFIDEEDE
jgi:predicted nucleic-acid-binding Zn-ribbon protein